MNRTRHSRTYPWRRPLRWLWLALALAASGVMVVHMPAGMGAGGSGKARTAMKPAGERRREGKRRKPPLPALPRRPKRAIIPGTPRFRRQAREKFWRAFPRLAA